MELPSVTLEDVLSWKPCWAEDESGRRRLRYYAKKLGGRATALDILGLTRIPVEDRLWVVLRPEMIPEDVLHEFACRCAERALSHVANPDPRSLAAIEAKRRWMRGEISDEELAAARCAARNEEGAAARNAAWAAEGAAAWAAEGAAARNTAWAAARAAAWGAAIDGERKQQASMLVEMLQEARGYTCG